LPESGELFELQPNGQLADVFSDGSIETSSQIEATYITNIVRTTGPMKDDILRYFTLCFGILHYNVLNDIF
jgi:hypothetical protein